MKNNFHVDDGDEFVKPLNFGVPDDQSSCVTGDHNGYSCKLEIGGRKNNVKKDLWTEEENRILIQAHGEVGNKWVEIAKRLPGRTENSTKRRQFSRRKCRTKWRRPSSLQNYIKNLNLEKRISTKNNSQISNDTNHNGHVDLGRVQLTYPRGSGCTGLVPENRNKNLDNGPKLHTNIAKVKVSPKPEAIEFCQGNNIGDYDFSEVPEFALDDNFFDACWSFHYGSKL
ncbi:hypothetical protein K7X08_031720 [Anisodus acutangulus]|uniref:Uncharacterized protein n=1 Tax=Anisodus acutangulus TaxID=402998 RepID=A0A9Q1RJK5_9SOLA|nr:hypothetical protein K7X08_031720 [Anisodus acutangulus]